MSLNYEQARFVYDRLKVGYKGVESRMQFNRGRSDKIEDEDVIQHVLAFSLPEEISDGVVKYTDLDPAVRDILDPYITNVLKIVNSKAKSVVQIFTIMTTLWCGKSKHFKHIHPLIQKDRCITWSFPIPLYIDPNSPKSRFYWTSQSDLFPKITYTSQRRMEKINAEYNAIEIPTDKQMSLLFDAARVPHWIDNTGHLYLWMVFEGVEMRDGHVPVTDMTLDMHGV